MSLLSATYFAVTVALALFTPTAIRPREVRIAIVFPEKFSTLMFNEH